jgi:hypothetical protein
MMSKSKSTDGGLMIAPIALGENSACSYSHGHRQWYWSPANGDHYCVDQEGVWRVDHFTHEWFTELLLPTNVRLASAPSIDVD